MAGWLALSAAVALGGLMLVPAALGLHRYVISGSSMGGALDRGSIAFEREVDVSRLRVGDVITYVPPPSAHIEGRVTHRIASIGSDRTGGLLLRTKGDANASRDPWRFRLAAPTQPRVVFHVPFAGYALAALGLRIVRILVIGVPALIVAVAALTAPRPRPAESEARA